MFIFSIFCKKDRDGSYRNVPFLMSLYLPYEINPKVNFLYTNQKMPMERSVPHFCSFRRSSRINDKHGSKKWNWKKKILAMAHSFYLALKAALSSWAQRFVASIGNIEKAMGVFQPWPSQPGTIHFLIGKFSYFVIRFLY